MKSNFSPYMLLAALILFTGCARNQENEQADEQDVILAQVNGETLTKADFEMTQAWLPSFARQLDSNANIEMSRFWSLLDIMRMSQDARDKGMLSDAARSLAIKEALAQKNIAAVNAPGAPITDAEIAACRNAHPEQFREPMAATVNYALVKSETVIPMMALGFYFARGAQLGYNFTSIAEEKRKVLGAVQGKNRNGRFIDAKMFNYIYVLNARENEDAPGRVGPFTASDNVLFSCPEAQNVLRTAPVGLPIARNIACSGEWKAFVIPEWRRDAAPMDDEKAGQLATERIRKLRNEAFREKYLAEKLAARNSAPAVAESAVPVDLK